MIPKANIRKSQLSNILFTKNIGFLSIPYKKAQCDALSGFSVIKLRHISFQQSYHEWKRERRQDQKILILITKLHRVQQGTQSDNDNCRHKRQIRNMALWEDQFCRSPAFPWIRVCAVLHACPHTVYLQEFCCCFDFQCPDRERSRASEKRLIHPNRHTCPFPVSVCHIAMILLRMLPLQWSSICF